jgi:hypothetical protein
MATNLAMAMATFRASPASRTCPSGGFLRKTFINQTHDEKVAKTFNFHQMPPPDPADIGQQNPRLQLASRAVFDIIATLKYYADTQPVLVAGAALVALPFLWSLISSRFVFLGLVLVAGFVFGYIFAVPTLDANVTPLGAQHYVERLRMAATDDARPSQVRFGSAHIAFTLWHRRQKTVRRSRFNFRQRSTQS